MVAGDSRKAREAPAVGDLCGARKRGLAWPACGELVNADEQADESANSRGTHARRHAGVAQERQSSPVCHAPEGPRDNTHDATRDRAEYDALSHCRHRCRLRIHTLPLYQSNEIRSYAPASVPSTTTVIRMPTLRHRFFRFVWNTFPSAY